ncbi:MAG: endonuclease III domain-containing protein [Pirellulales bacterium]|nr:endonuclease III domain-containing protein [Pirellulales bacterium]
MVGAVLVQNTSWQNVVRAIDNLSAAGVLDPHAVRALPIAELEELIRPAGYYRIKAKRVRNLVEYLVDRYDGSLLAMGKIDASQLREELLAVHGVGPETADAILLYALQKPVMVVDAYTHRIWSRHGWIDYDSDYHRLQELIAEGLPDETPILNEMHALLVHVGRHWCKSVPKCDQCPLAELLPPGGIVEAI